MRWVCLFTFAYLNYLVISAGHQGRIAHLYSVGQSLVAMACSVGRLPTAEPIESKLVDMLWPNDNIVAAPVNRM